MYVAIQEIPEINWGMYGKQVDLSAMRAPATASQLSMAIDLSRLAEP